MTELTTLQAKERYHMKISEMINKSHRGDCIQIMQSMPEGSVDAIITDPPYCSGGVSEASRTAAKAQGVKSAEAARSRFAWFVGDNMGTAGLVFLLRAMAFEAARVVKKSGSILVFCDWRMIPNITPAIESAGLRFQNIVVWDKGSIGMGQGFRSQHEMILHFTNGKPEYFDKGTPNIISCRRVAAGGRHHQTQKPVELLQRLIRVVTKPGDIILDPFGGSGSLAVAASGIERNHICIEREQTFVDIANMRSSSTQKSLF